ncbi:coenzyme F420:L-glutamate ligase [candidate division MSBL1 archaeon SCGC-AAA259D18]|uniref:Coenzyme F420:L-glutamate ligase n=1 Tax=candidate division MSBL1 archaeon SCGC-AAA259D18 TaxID=1698262 RepID=A0A133U9I9_9EURY|nr:coenzyme F420:L-glutamate ligase [candidate division MSBL1 archaeon SCGC-AAA259D18]
MEIFPLSEIPLVGLGDDVGELLLESCERQRIELEDGDVVVVAQSIVSKAEGNVMDLTSIEPSSRSKRIADEIGEDPRKVEVILNQTEEIVRVKHVLISRTHHGFVCADAGVDSSNVEAGKVTKLPENPDVSAKKIRKRIKEKTGKEVAVIISDSWGRPFRLGAVGFAVGVSGMKPLMDLRGRKDIYGVPLETTIIAPPDSLAAVASLEMGEANERVPAVLIKGATYEPGEGCISELIRSKEKDLFR